MFHRQRSYQEALPYSIDTAPNSRALERVVRTIESLGLDSKPIVLVGSAALAAYGINLGRDRPHDADLTVPGSLFLQLDNTSRTPSGQPLERKLGASNNLQSILVAPPLNEDAMPVDIISRFNPTKQNVAANEAAFLEHYRAHSHLIPGTRVSVASLDYLAKELKLRSPKDTAAQYDYEELLRQLHQLR